MSDKTNLRSVTVQKVRNRMILFYTVMILVLFFSGFTYAFVNLRKITNNELSKTVSSLGLQYMTSIDSFTSVIESDCTDIFRREDIMSYDPIVNNYAEYESSAAKSEIKTKLLEAAAGKPYTDFMLLFSDNSAVGKVSSGTTDSVNKLTFDYFADSLGDENDAWLFGLRGTFRKIYYVRGVTDHSVFMISFYTDELDKIFAFDRSSENKMFFLTDPGNRVVYTNCPDVDQGSAMPAKYENIFDGTDGDCAVTKQYIGTLLETECGWKTYTLIKSMSLVKISPITAITSFSMALILIVFSVFTGILSCGRYVVSDIADPNSEFIDPMTGALNEYGLDEKISEMMETSLVGSTYAFILLGIKDSEQIKNTVSLRCWNSIRMNLIHAAEEYFSKKRISIGRTSDDNIAIFADYSEFDIFKAHESLISGCEGFCRSFENFTIGSENDMKLHISIGVCIYPDHAEDFDGLIEKASEALKEAEKSDNDSFEIYKPADKKEAVKK